MNDDQQANEYGEWAVRVMIRAVYADGTSVVEERVRHERGTRESVERTVRGREKATLRADYPTAQIVGIEVIDMSLEISE